MIANGFLFTIGVALALLALWFVLWMLAWMYIGIQRFKEWDRRTMEESKRRTGH